MNEIVAKNSRKLKFKDPMNGIIPRNLLPFKEISIDIVPSISIIEFHCLNYSNESLHY